MRRYDDVDGQGGLNAVNRSKERFIKYFVDAAMAKPGSMQVWDGGGYSVLVTVDRNYFLFGRALHLFEDSFSPDHTVRTADDRFEKVRQVKSYLCANGSEQHAHPAYIPPYEDGDVIWKPGSKWQTSMWSSYKPSNMKTVALVATEATKDVWAAFIRTMSVESAVRDAVAQREATAVAQQWLSVMDEPETLSWYTVKDKRGKTYVQAKNTTEDGGQGRTQAACMKEDWKIATTQAEKVKEFEEGQRICLYNMVPTWGNENDIDPALHLPYNWAWRNPDHAFLEPPADWKISNPVYVNVKIANRVNLLYMRNEGDWISVSGNRADTSWGRRYL